MTLPVVYETVMCLSAVNEFTTNEKCAYFTSSAGLFLAVKTPSFWNEPLVMSQKAPVPLGGLQP